MVLKSITLMAAAMAFSGVAMAADCFDSPTNWFYPQVYNDAWNVRNTACGQAKLDAWNGHVHGTAADAGQLCYDAMENIINQCVYAMNKPGGTYKFDGKVYTISMTPS